MLVQDFVQIDRDFDAIRARVRADPRALIAASAGAAYREGERLSLRLTPLLGVPRLGKTIDVDLAEPYEREDRLVLPMHWWAPGATRLFPHLDGDLEFAPLGAKTSQITLMASYDPPLGFVGRRADTLLLHRIAEASIRSFLVRVVRNLEQPERARLTTV
ncbi:MAG TPA: hypothetical protein VND54_08195 [Candidatus Saccharimonadales bacterium]|nr:hypothetical protein [Candidatus Saccharimonadales bacterium]